MKNFRKYIAVLLVLMLPACSASKSVETGAEEKTEGWGFKKVAGTKPQFTAEQVSTMEKYSCIYLADSSDKVYLTFDEGYENGYTDSILKTLAKHKVPAAFFVTGPYLKTEGDLIQKMVDGNHIVGNHTVNHPSIPSLDAAKITSELNDLSMKFRDEYGGEMSFFRPPMGEYNERTLDVTNRLGYKTVFWSLTYKDWERDTVRGADYAYGQVMKHMHPGAVILLHAVSKDNADALERIIVDTRAKGYEFGSLDELV